MFSPDGKRFAVPVRYDPETFAVRVYDRTDNAILHTFVGHNRDIETMAFSPDGKTLATASMDNTVVLWDLTRK